MLSAEFVQGALANAMFLKTHDLAFLSGLAVSHDVTDVLTAGQELHMEPEDNALWVRLDKGELHSVQHIYSDDPMVIEALIDDFYDTWRKGPPQPS